MKLATNSFYQMFNEYARKNGLLKEKDKNLEGSDIREGLTSIISVNISEDLLQFEGQTKAKLGTPKLELSWIILFQSSWLTF